MTDLEKLWRNAEKKLKDRHLILVCNTKRASHLVETSCPYSLDTEYFSDDEFEQVVSMFSALGMAIDIFTYEDKFFRYVIENSPSNLLVYNAAQSGAGPGRKSLVPAFCNLHKILCTGSDAYVVSLCRHKYHVNLLLSQAGVRVPKTWLYYYGWLMEQSPASGTKVLLKPIYESASIGIDNTSMQLYSSTVDQLIQRRIKQHHQPIIAQEFIPGYEVEVPMICVNDTIYHLPPVGISIGEKRNLGNEILNYERIYFDQYEFYDFAAENQKIASALCACAAKVTRILGMEGLCRVDFRVTSDGAFFVTDVSTNPHFILHSSVNFSFARLGLTPNHVAKSILSAALEKR